MQRISSKQTFWMKRIFPVIWFGFVALALAHGAASLVRQQSYEALPNVLIPSGMLIFGFLIMSRLVFDLADEVDDRGDALIVRRGGKTATIPLAEIVNVDSSFTSPPRVMLTLRQETPFGRKIAFSPRVKFSLNPFKANPLVDELVARIDQARSSSRV